MFGAATLQLPAWAQDLSPFTHVPKAPAAAVGAVPVIGLVAVATVLVAFGLAWLRRRDLALPA
jgi:ABC-2 type transport system permease protein